MGLLNEVFHNPRGWSAFQKQVGGVGVETWVEIYDELITEQVRRRAKLPDHHSTGAVDEELTRVRESMEPRSFCLRNAERTSRMLELVWLRLHRCDDPLIYARATRGKPRRQRRAARTRGRCPRPKTVRKPSSVKATISPARRWKSARDRGQRAPVGRSKS